MPHSRCGVEPSRSVGPPAVARSTEGRGRSVPVDLPSLLARIGDDEPAGENLRLTSSVFDELQKLATPLSAEEDVFSRKGKEAEWPAVLRIATDALRTRSKDLELAAWIALAELRLRGIPGLCEGMELLVELLERFWDRLHPGLDDGSLDLEFRAKPIAWLDGQLAAPPRTTARSSLGALREIPLIPRPAERAL